MNPTVLGRFRRRFSLPVNKETSSFRPGLTTLEDRTVPAGVLMASGASTGIATWGIQPTYPIDSTTNSIYTAVDVVTKDINNQPVDFNKDGYADLLVLRAE